MPTPVSVAVTKQPAAHRAPPYAARTTRSPGAAGGATSVHADLVGGVAQRERRGRGELGRGVRGHHASGAAARCPAGTVGGRIAWAKTPRASSASESAHRGVGVADDHAG